MPGVEIITTNELFYPDGTGIVLYACAGLSIWLALCVLVARIARTRAVKRNDSKLPHYHERVVNSTAYLVSAIVVFVFAITATLIENPRVLNAATRESLEDHYGVQFQESVRITSDDFAMVRGEGGMLRRVEIVVFEDDNRVALMTSNEAGVLEELPSANTP